MLKQGPLQKHIQDIEPKYLPKIISMSLKEDIDWYKNEVQIHIDSMKSFYEKMNLPTAIRNASEGKNPGGKMNDHQWRVGFKKGKIGADQLFLYTQDILICKSFEEIFKITEIVKNDISGLGDLWSYDTALRIGFNLRLYPQLVYVQRGVEKGVKKALDGNRPKGRTLSINIFPSEIHQLKPYEIENFLCVWGKEKITFHS